MMFSYQPQGGGSLCERRTASRYAHGYRQHLARMQRVCTDYTPSNQALCEQLSSAGDCAGTRNSSNSTPQFFLPQLSNSKDKHKKHQKREVLDSQVLRLCSLLTSNVSFLFMYPPFLPLIFQLDTLDCQVPAEILLPSNSSTRANHISPSSGPKTNSTSASRVFVFDHRVRRGPSDWHEIPVYNVRHRGPLHRAHVDQSYAGAEMVLREKIPNADEVGRLMQRRLGIVNVG